MKYKKPAVDLTDLALGVILLGIIVSIGANILINMRDARLTDLDTFTTTNESTFINSTSDSLANTWGKSVTKCWASYNQSNCNNTLIAGDGMGFNISIPSGNYTSSISGVNGKITLTNATSCVYPNVSCTYDCYNTSRPDWELSDDAATGLAEYGNWFTTIVIVGVAAVILSLIFMAFGRNSGGVGAGVNY